MIREFTVLDFKNLIRKLDRFWINLMNGKLKAFRGTHNAGCGAIMNHHEYFRHKSMDKVPVDINYDKDNPFLKADRSESAVSNDIWKHLKPILNETNIGMKSFLKKFL